MKVWLVNPHDAIPGEGWGYKHAMFLAEKLASQGHDVTLWTVNFAHATKQLRSPGWKELSGGERIKILLVPVKAYRRHIGVARIQSLLDFARGVWQRSATQSKPDVIIMTVPTPFSDWVCARLARRYGAKLILDFRDLWPEIFALAFPRPLRRFAFIPLSPLYALRKYAFDRADALVGVCETYLGLARRISPRLAKVPTRIIYSTGVDLVAFRRMMASPEHDAELPPKAATDVWVVYAGTIGSAYDIAALVEAARLLGRDPRAAHVKILVAGAGPLLSLVTDAIEREKLTNLVYLGTLTMPKLCRVYAKSDIGLSIYAPGSTVAIPAKAFDYYAAGLPIVNSLDSEFGRTITDQRIGENYRSGDGASLAAALLKLASPEAAARRADIRARLEAIAPEFDRDRQYDKMIEVLDELGLPGRAPQAPGPQSPGSGQPRKPSSRARSELEASQ
jgi:glycosyltransferase involved in cell wall biosynthesis